MQPYDLVIAPALFFLCSAIAVVLFFADKKDPKNRSAAIISFSGGIWILSALLADITGPENYSISLFLNRLVFVAVAALVSAMLYLSFLMSGKLRSNNFLKKLLVCITVISFFVVLSTPSVVQEVQFREWGSDLVYGPYYFVFAIYAASLIVISTAALIYSYFRQNRERQSSTKYFLIGLIVFMILTTLVHLVIRNIVGNDEYYRFGNYSIIFFVAFTAIAILKHHVFSTRVLITEIVVLLISGVLFSEVFLSNSIVSALLRLVVWILVGYGGYLVVKKERQDASVRNKLEKANSALRELDQAKDDFINIASHQLKSPVAIIQNSIEMAEMQKTYDPDFFETSRKQIRKLNKIVSEILLASKLSTKKYSAEHREDVNIEELVKAIISEQVQLYQPKSTPGLTSHLPKGFTLHCDQLYFTEAVTNIVSNAVKYSSNKGKAAKVEIELSFDVQSRHFILRCRDNGIGMSEEDLGKVFHKFERANNAQSTASGSGLGMFITKEIVEGHGGRIEIKSELNKGTEVRVTIPVPE